MALNRLNDYLFKWTFGREEHKHIARAIAAENVFSLDDGERYLYDMREKFFFDQGAVANRINTLESNLKDATAEAAKAKSEAEKTKSEAEKYKLLYEQLLANNKVS